MVGGGVFFDSYFSTADYVSLVISIALCDVLRMTLMSSCVGCISL